MSLDLQEWQAETINTERLCLRPLRREDADVIATALSDFSVTRMLSRPPYPFTFEDAAEWLEGTMNGDAREWAFAITQPADQVLIGIITIELRQGGYHLGYWLRRYYWGRGFMSEAASAIVGRFFAEKGDITLHSGAFAENAGSLKVQQRLGFQVTGLRDTYAESRGAMVQEVTTALRSDYFRPYHFD
ncbi:GNAT family N-acetyltransferase [Martelella mediterranea]|uniref:GNAT family N-acetyltransferase n=1 Tax=uncultured Martelella sp. TaxID=392331 RepID=UPI000D06217F|nr:GNAT family N-acetyltransferase [uncultured Martelella sp.]